ncbi:hypothetical protein COOONC_13701 [Cooperia oncophora]
MLDWTTISNLFERASNNVVLTLKLVRCVLGDPTKFKLHPRLLEALIQHENLLQACEDLIPGFADIVSAPLRNDQLVKEILSGNGSNFTAGALPAVLFCSDENLPAGIFWSVFKDNPHVALTSLWNAKTISVTRNSYMLLLNNLLAIAQSPVRRSLNKKMERLFLLAFASVVSSLAHSIAKR